MKKLLLLLAGAALTAAPLFAETADRTLYILSVGVEPQRSFHGLNDPYAHDANHMATALLAARPLFGDVKTTVINGKSATPDNVKRALQDLAKAAKGPKDVAFVHFSTHGGWDSRGGFSFSLVGTEAGVRNVWQEFGDDEVLRTLSRVQCPVFLTLDTCSAGGLIPRGNIATPRISYLVACGRDESSVGEGMGVRKPHGVFVTAFCEALRGSADANRDGIVTWGEVIKYVPDRANSFAPAQHAEIRTAAGAEGIALAKLDSAPAAEARPAPAATASASASPAPAAKPAPLFDETVARNPFGLPDVNKPFVIRFKEFWQTTPVSGDGQDENAAAWGAVSLPQAADITGRWSARWKNDNGEWMTGEAIIKVKDERTFIIYRDARARYLFELRTQKPAATQQPGHRLIGRYVNLVDEEDNGPWVGRVMGNDRIDGKWQGGRWDLRRTIGAQ